VDRAAGCFFLDGAGDLADPFHSDERPIDFFVERTDIL
jgi:hypothetical protein